MPTDRKQFDVVELTEKQIEVFREELDAVWKTLQNIIPEPEDMKAKAVVGTTLVLAEQMKGSMLANPGMTVSVLGSIGTVIYDLLSRIENAGVVALEEENTE